MEADAFVSRTDWDEDEEDGEAEERE